MRGDASTTTPRVLIHSLVFSPDGVSTAYLYNDIAQGLQARGIEVVVVTSTPHYNALPSALARQPLTRRLLGVFFTSTFDGVPVYHVPLRKHRSALRRMLSFIYWHVAATILALCLPRISIVLSPSPPLTIGLVSILIARLKGARVVYNVQEIYPDLLIHAGHVRSSPVIGIFRRLERFVYNRSDAVVTIDETFGAILAPRIADRSKLHVIPNFVDTDLYRPTDEAPVLPAVFPSQSGRITVVYAGNIGVFQDWEPVLEAAHVLRDEGIDFWIVGEGVRKDWLAHEIAARRLDHVRLFPYQRREDMPGINAAGDIHFIVVNPELAHEGLPSKVLTIMACAKPLVVVTGDRTPLDRFLRDTGCAIVITTDIETEFPQAIRRLARDPDLRRQMGARGHQVITRGYTKDVVIDRYVDLLLGL